ncbi:hypothetical protein Tco_1030812 [Tanacetum coccineum]|uniref:Uncharacterized protein n=1 Tax=Tanacetum coccineum TaxID=301880 RepID=A0ABQ5G7L7_9ASTR
MEPTCHVIADVASTSSATSVSEAHLLMWQLTWQSGCVYTLGSIRFVKQANVCKLYWVGSLGVLNGLAQFRQKVMGQNVSGIVPVVATETPITSSPNENGDSSRHASLIIKNSVCVHVAQAENTSASTVPANRYLRLRHEVAIRSFEYTCILDVTYGGELFGGIEKSQDVDLLNILIALSNGFMAKMVIPNDRSSDDNQGDIRRLRLGLYVVLMKPEASTLAFPSVPVSSRPHAYTLSTKTHSRHHLRVEESSKLQRYTSAISDNQELSQRTSSIRL